MTKFQTTLNSNFTGRIGSWTSDNGYNVSNLGLSEGLIAYYGLNNNTKFGENDTSVLDYSGNPQINGTFEGGANYTVNGRYSDALSLDGDGDYVDLDDTIRGEISQNVTVSAWINVNGIDETEDNGIFKFQF